MRVLLIKTSSMGDIIHTLPALTDAKAALPDIQFDWVVENNFVDIPRWHPAVANIIPVALRRWRKNIFLRDTRNGWKALRKQLQEYEYDLVLDAQGLVKSAFLAFFAKGKRAGLDFSSARESFASLAYQQKCKVNFYQHAIVRMRSLFSLALNYPMPETYPDFGLINTGFASPVKDEKYLVFLFGTTWNSKQWPETFWRELADFAGRAGYRVKISGYGAEEIAQAERIGKNHNAIDILENLDINAIAALLANAKAVVSVDTGFAHLAAALGVPTISIYGATNPAYTGATGKKSIQLSADFPCSPCYSRNCTFKQSSPITPACYATIPPLKVFAEIQKLLA